MQAWDAWDHYISDDRNADVIRTLLPFLDADDLVSWQSRLHTTCVWVTGMLVWISQLQWQSSLTRNVNLTAVFKHILSLNVYSIHATASQNLTCCLIGESRGSHCALRHVISSYYRRCGSPGRQRRWWRLRKHSMIKFCILSHSDSEAWYYSITCSLQTKVCWAVHSAWLWCRVSACQFCWAWALFEMFVDCSDVLVHSTCSVSLFCTIVYA